MKRSLLLVSGVVAILLTIIVGGLPVAAKGYESGIAIQYEGNTYYFHGMPVGDGWDVPGHEWVQVGPNHLRGKHYNSGPSPNFWSPDAPDGGLLYVVDAIIDVQPSDLAADKAAFYKAKGYVHQHYLVDENGIQVPGITAYLKHTARTSFTLKHMIFEYQVTPGIDYNFPPNW